jgi:hypothetical protein
MSRLLLVAICLLLFAMLGCRSVQPSDVVGTWIMNDQSRKELPPEFQGAIGKIIVNADGTFVASELPEPLHPVPPYDMKVRMRLDSGNGTWKLASRQGAQHLQLEFRDIPSADENSKGSYGLPLIVSRGWSAIRLYYTLADPDEARTAEFEKQK